MSFPGYERYKDSGVEWLGDVPEHWRIKRVKNVAEIINGYPFDSKLFNPEEGYPLIRIRDLNTSEADTYYTGNFIEAAAITSEDVLIGMDGDFNVGRWRGKGVALLNQRLCCIRGKSKLITRLLEYALPFPLKSINELTYSTTVKHLSSFQVEKTSIAIPIIETELQKIVTFLDRETAKIDALIAEQKRLIELLKEKRQAFISHAVTKGLNPDAPMKDSGIEWLSEVPAHWAVSPIKYYVLIRSGGNPSKQNQAYWDGDMPWASAKDLKTEVLLDTKDHITHFAIESKQASLVSIGSVLVVVRGMILAKTFPVTVAGVAMAINQDLKAIEGINGLDNGFLAWLLRGATKESMSRADEAGHGTKALRMNDWLSMPVTAPPLQEQLSITDFLDSETTKLDTLTTEAQRAIKLLKERRTALISAAVTGKIDVRNQQSSV